MVDSILIKYVFVHTEKNPGAQEADARGAGLLIWTGSV